MTSGEKAKIRAIADWMLQDLSTPLATEFLADQAGFTEYRLRKGFLEVFGAPPARWFRCQRMQFAAKKLQDTDETVSTIAESVGYKNQSRFADSFRSEFGCSPLEFRNRGMATNSPANSIDIISKRTKINE